MRSRTALQRSAAPLLALSLLPLASGCDALASGESAWQGSVTDSAGITIVRSTGVGLWGGTPGWELEELFRVGGMDAGPEAQFGLVAGIDVDAEGNVYILDQQAREIRVFGPDGSGLRVIGGPGEGPGEFGAGLMAVFERRDTVWALDVTGGGIQGFARSGERIAGVPFDLSGGIPIRLDESERGIVAQRRGISVDGMPQMDRGDAVTVIRGERPDTLVTLPMGESFSLQGGTPQLSFFEPEPLWDVSDEGALAWGTNKVYRIRITNAEGTLLRIVERRLEAQQLTEAMERRILDALLDQMVRASGAPAEILAPMLEQATFSETLPILAQLILAEDGQLWVQRVGELSEELEAEGFDLQDLGSPTWDLFDREGRYLGELRLPDRFQPFRLIDDVLWGVQLDDLGVQSVVGMEVVKP